MCACSRFDLFLRDRLFSLLLCYFAFLFASVFVSASNSSCFPASVCYLGFPSSLFRVLRLLDNLFLSLFLSLLRLLLFVHSFRLSPAPLLPSPFPRLSSRLRHPFPSLQEDLDTLKANLGR